MLLVGLLQLLRLLPLGIRTGVLLLRLLWFRSRLRPRRSRSLDLLWRDDLLSQSQRRDLLWCLPRASAIMMTISPFSVKTGILPSSSSASACSRMFLTERVPSIDSMYMPRRIDSVMVPYSITPVAFFTKQANRFTRVIASLCFIARSVSPRIGGSCRTY